MTSERQAAIRATLEQDDPEWYYMMGGNRSLAAARHDYDVKWELLLALEKAQERIATLEQALEQFGVHTPSCSIGEGSACSCGLDAALEANRRRVLP